MKTLALIGVGRWGKNILSTLEKIPEANLKYICARNKTTLEPYDEKYKKLTDWRELLKKDDLEAVLIATPPSTHFELIGAFLRAGKNVFVEKPMVLSTNEARRVEKLVLSSGKIFMVGYLYLFNDYIGYLKKEIESNYELRNSSKAQVVRNIAQSDRDEHREFSAENYPCSEQPAPRKSFVIQKSNIFGKILSVKSEHVLSPSRPDTDIFWDTAPHPLSIIQYLFEPKKLLSADGELEHDHASVKIQFENTPSLEISSSCFGDKKIRKLTLVGEKATAVLDEILEKNKLSIAKNGRTSYPEIEAGAPLKNELEHFLRCLQTGQTPLTIVNFGFRITDWLEMISKKLK